MAHVCAFLALAMTSLALPAQAAVGGVLTQERLTLQLPASPGTLTFGIGTSGYEPEFPAVAIRDSAESRFEQSGYAQAPHAYEGLRPGSCAYAEGPHDLRCGLMPVNGEPFYITYPGRRLLRGNRLQHGAATAEHTILGASTRSRSARATTTCACGASARASRMSETA